MSGLTELLARPDDVRKRVEDAILDVAVRPPGLRGPWIFDEEWLQSSARRIRISRTPATGGKP